MVNFLAVTNVKVKKALLQKKRKVFNVGFNQFMWKKPDNTQCTVYNNDINHS